MTRWALAIFIYRYDQFKIIIIVLLQPYLLSLCSYSLRSHACGRGVTRCAVWLDRIDVVDYCTTRNKNKNARIREWKRRRSIWINYSDVSIYCYYIISKWLTFMHIPLSSANKLSLVVRSAFCAWTLYTALDLLIWSVVSRIAYARSAADGSTCYFPSLRCAARMWSTVNENRLQAQRQLDAIHISKYFVFLVSVVLLQLEEFNWIISSSSIGIPMRCKCIEILIGKIDGERVSVGIAFIASELRELNSMTPCCHSDAVCVCAFFGIDLFFNFIFAIALAPQR